MIFLRKCARVSRPETGEADDRLPPNPPMPNAISRSACKRRMRSTSGTAARRWSGSTANPVMMGTVRTAEPMREQGMEKMLPTILVP